MKTKVSLFRLAILTFGGALLLGAACGSNEAEMRRRREMTENFNRAENANSARQMADLQNRQRFASSEFSQPPQRVQLTDQPYVRGKLLILNRRESSESFSLSDLSAYGNFMEIRAETPEEVGTVVLLHYKKQRAGTFVIEGQGRSVPGYVWVCDLTMIDRSIPAVIYRRTFRGAEAGTEVAQAGSPSRRQGLIPQDATEVVGEEPHREVANYLISLPRR
jgi:hypothetical protein